MNRREAIAALTALPALARVARADLKPSDVIVVECEGIVSDEQRAQITTTLRQVWPDNKIVVLEESTRLKVVDGAKA